MKKWAVILVGILVVLLILAVIKDILIKVAVEQGVKVVTGLSLNIGSLKVGLINTLVDIKNLRVLNPSNFKDSDMLNMPEIYVAYDLPAVIGGNIHLKDARINLKEFDVVKNDKGQLNLDSLKVVQAQKTGGKPEEKAGGKAPQIQIDRLRLKIGKAVFKDYSAGPNPRVTEFNVNIDEEYKNITNPYTLVSLIVVKALMNTSIASLANFDINGLSGSISDTLAGAQKMAAETAKKAQAAAQQTIKEATETTKVAQQAASEVTNTLSGAFKNPFGGGK